MPADPTTPRPRLFCFGYGFSAAALGRRLAARGFEIAGTCRQPEKAERMKEQGVAAYLFDGRLADADAALKGTTHLLLSVPPGETGDPVLAVHGKAIAGLAPDLQWLGYLSTTGVYGDREGDWVDEESPLEPGTERGARRLAAEQGWQALAEAHDLPLHIFRLAGIYGPGRNQLQSLREGKARRIIKPGQVFSRIHVEDIAGILEASIDRPHPGRAYNVCDDEAAPPQDVVAFAAELLGMAPPPEIDFEAAELSPMARSFYSESKRVTNQRLHDELGVTLRYPNYREGLRALLAEETD
ncbi:MAG: NAD-dependent epimerase/dehydratase family protein [Rhizobiales bacterium]|nr:NAD-dependent epimerase/dehydratase family protein [Hyphomicrobiales bacterium]